MLESKNKNPIYLKALLLAFCFSVLGALAEGSPIAVLYPDVREPYSGIFRDIVGGVERQAEAKVTTFSLKKGDSLDTVRDWLNANNPKAVILLGNRGKYLAEHLGSQYATVAGAVILSNENITRGLAGISLAPAPNRLFAKLKEMAPKVRRVSVIYHADTNGWLIELAKVAAENNNLNLVALPAQDVRDAAALYREVLEGQDNGSDAIWLLQGDPTLDERSLLRTILNQAWSKNSVVFSSNPSHVKRGALFSLYPDNFNMGKSLALKAEQMATGQKVGAEPLQDLLMAVNVRTAEHLNLKISRSNEQEFDLVFPSR